MGLCPGRTLPGTSVVCPEPRRKSDSSYHLLPALLEAPSRAPRLSTHLLASGPHCHSLFYHVVLFLTLWGRREGNEYKTTHLESEVIFFKCLFQINLIFSKLWNYSFLSKGTEGQLIFN